MPYPEPFSFSRSLSFSTLTRLQALLQQSAERLGADIWSEISFQKYGFTTEELLNQLDLIHFTAVISQPFSALLVSKIASGADYQVSLTFDSETIAHFLDKVALLLQLHFAATDLPLENKALDKSVLEQLARARLLVQTNNVHIQSEFTLNLVAAFATESPATAVSPEERGSFPESSKPPLTEASLLQQVAQERLINQVVTQIRQSLELPVILQTAVDQVRECLQVDRLVIYQLERSAVASLKIDGLKIDGLKNSLKKLPEQAGSVIYEARCSIDIPSVLNFSETNCFVNTIPYQDNYQQNLAIAIPNVEVRYAAVPCLLNFLQQAQVRAKMVAPIVVGNQLWGLLIAHQCQNIRFWQENEQRFLQQIAEHLAIAISQAQLYAELQQQKQTLKQRVIERTQDLHDMVLAAQSANRAKSEFLASVSHELRTPLTCIIGMSATLQRWSSDRLNERQQQFLQTIHDSGEHLLTLINDILDLSYAESGKVVLNLRDFSLARLAQQTLKVLVRQAMLQEVNLELDLRVEANDRFVADPRRLRQILFNLLSNAIKFTPKGGKVTLRVFSEEQLAIFQVKDTGIGISKLQIPFLFQKFQQLSTGYHRQYEGTGLGLALTKQLVDLHGGTIEVESTEGIGTVFTVRIPSQRLTDSNLPAKPQEPLVLDQPRGRLVLIANQEEMASLICDILTAAGFQVVWILEGSTAMSQIEAFRPVAIITDTRLPDIDGSRLIQCLRKNPSTKHLKIIALTTQTALNNNVVLEADECLLHPVRPDHLLQTVIRLTSQLIDEPAHE